MKEYLLIAKGRRATWDSTGAEEWESVMEGFGKWISQMEAKNLWIRGDRLTTKRVDIEGAKIHDGPFAETKELTGFFLFRAENIDQAVQLAKGCPSLLHDSLSLHELEGDRE